jgi:hypothetical protein
MNIMDYVDIMDDVKKIIYWNEIHYAIRSKHFLEECTLCCFTCLIFTYCVYKPIDPKMTTLYFSHKFIFPHTSLKADITERLLKLNLMFKR